MRVLVIGSGGREHAVCRKLRESPALTQLYCAPGNGGIASVAECVPIKATDIESVVSFSKEHRVDLVVVTPDDPLALGMVDALEAAGIRAFGPRKNAAVIEASKAFSKDFMKKYRIPTAAYEVFRNSRDACAYIRAHGAPVVVKADGLALGKGVIVAATVEEAEQAARDMLDGGAFGASGSRVVVEDCLTGPEVSVLVFTDGTAIRPMVSAQDHKRVYDNDRGPNTGGMGAFAPSPRYTPEIAAWCMEHIFRPTVEGMKAEGREFRGVLYFGLMLTPGGPRVIEYNARFGDPETQAVLMLLRSDLLSVFCSVIDGTLERCPVEFSAGAAACVVMASGGYPGKYETGLPISGLDRVTDAVVFHAGTRIENGGVVTAGGRVLGVTAEADSMDEAIAKAYDNVSRISFPGAHYRRDIGRK